MRVKRYNNFDKNTDKSDQNLDIDKMCTLFGISNYKINSDGSIDVDDNVSLYNKLCTMSIIPGLPYHDDYNSIKFFKKGYTHYLKKLPIKFNKVNGFFNINGNNLTTLEGCPLECRSFHCLKNLLDSLDHGPRKVTGSYDFSDNNISDVSGFPSIFPEWWVEYGNNPISVVLGLFELKAVIPEVITLLNEYDVIEYDRKIEKRSIYMSGLRLVYQDLKLEVPEWLEESETIGRDHVWNLIF